MAWVDYNFDMSRMNFYLEARWKGRKLPEVGFCIDLWSIFECFPYLSDRQTGVSEVQLPAELEVYWSVELLS